MYLGAARITAWAGSGLIDLLYATGGGKYPCISWDSQHSMINFVLQYNGSTYISIFDAVILKVMFHVNHLVTPCLLLTEKYADEYRGWHFPHSRADNPSFNPSTYARSRHSPRTDLTI